MGGAGQKLLSCAIGIPEMCLPLPKRCFGTAVCISGLIKQKGKSTQQTLSVGSPLVILRRLRLQPLLYGFQLLHSRQPAFVILQSMTSYLTRRIQLIWRSSVFFFCLARETRYAGQRNSLGLSCAQRSKQ